MGVIRDDTRSSDHGSHIVRASGMHDFPAPGSLAFFIWEVWPLIAREKVIS